jgi:holo-[acyl-carrier protein] synthase
MNYIGIDIIEIDRIEKAISRWGDSFLHRVYTDPELKLYHNKPLSLAARFAGKEAVIKALGPQAQGISWREIEILSDPGGKPSLRLYGKARRRADSLHLDKLAISLSHSKEYAIALVVGDTRKG